jgi:peptidoglycan-associated lipoprotein
MRHPLLVVAVVATVALVACHKKSPPPAAPPPPPAAPAAPPPAPPPARPDVAPQPNEYDRLRQMSVDELERAGLFGEVRFDFDKAEIRDADRPALNKDAETLKKFDFMRVTIEGHCDERGTVEYNLALGERRAKAAYDYIVSLGVPAERLKTVSYGKEIPACHESSEGCWQRNRRAKFTVTGKSR